MNSASTAPAISRASVVLPTPGGPHRIIECSRPDSNAIAQRLAGPEQVLLADDLVQRLRAQALGERAERVVEDRVGHGRRWHPRAPARTGLRRPARPARRRPRSPELAGVGGVFSRHSRCRPGPTLHGTDAAPLTARVARHRPLQGAPAHERHHRHRSPHQRRRPPPRRCTARREYLSFKLGAEEYGIDILKVQEIRGYEHPTRIANAPHFIKGVVNLRGVIVPIVDMRLRFGLRTCSTTASPSSSS